MLKYSFHLILLPFFVNFGTLQAQKKIKPKAEVSGKEVFELNCAACHSFTQKTIGPNLSFVGNEMPISWIKKAIQNTNALVSTGDRRSKELVKEYKQMMPSFEYLPEKEIDALVDYIFSQRKEKSTPPVDGLTGRVLNPVKSSGLTLQLKYINTAPLTSDKIPLARINTMVVANNRLFLSDLRGIIYEVKNENLSPYFDLSKLNPDFIHVPGLATGLGSYAFHPEFQSNGLFYTSHTEKANTQTADFEYSKDVKVALQWVITEWKVPNPNATAFEGKPREFLRINMVSQIHGMQEIAFNPHSKKGDDDYGLLYVGIGDGGASENGHPEICNSVKTPWSSVLRINPLGNNSKNGKYGIPSSNPFIVNGKVSEVFARGFRNPNRIYWTPDGKMLVSDIGHKNVEELNVCLPGKDYGWPYREGSFIIDPFQNMDLVFKLPNPDSTYILPALQYDHEDGNAISSGFTYFSSKIPLLKDKYIFGDVVTGKVYFAENSKIEFGKQTDIFEFILEVDGKKSNFRELTNNHKTDLRFGQGMDGEIYLYTKTDARIYKIVGCK